MRTPGAAEHLPSIPGFTVEKEVGRGGMAVVFRAAQIDPPRPVALKMLRPQAGHEVYARLQAEAEALTRLRHPNVLEVFAVGEHAGRPYLVMELCDGSSLDNYLLGQPQPPRVAARWTMTLARAVQYCHEQGVIHRDLKPANILLSETMLKIADFGLAKLLDGDMNLTRSGAVLGSIGYMAPEQARGAAKHVGPAADIWALGCILYDMLTGDPPFHGTIDAESLTRMLEHDPTPPEGPPGLVAVCLKCLRKKQAERYASAGALADDLDRWRQGEPVAAEAESREPAAERRRWFKGLRGRRSGA
jgi:eukaryotic-like serine/threonine-protein kinase